jgi:hypothetical protein
LISGAGAVISSSEIGVFNKSIGLSEVVYYDIGNISMKIKYESLDTILNLELKKDSLIRLDINQLGIKKKVYKR